MFDNSKTFSSFSVDNLDKAEDFYKNALGLSVKRQGEMGLDIDLANGGKIFIYSKPNHKPASFTILNFIVSNIDKAVDELTNKGIKFKRYKDFDQDKKGVVRSTSPELGPSIAWFTDPAKNILAIMES